MSTKKTKKPKKNQDSPEETTNKKQEKFYADPKFDFELSQSAEQLSNILQLELKKSDIMKAAIEYFLAKKTDYKIEILSFAKVREGVRIRSDVVERYHEYKERKPDIESHDPE